MKALTLMAALALAACGGDDAETPRGAPEEEFLPPARESAVDTTLGDTSAVDTTAAAAPVDSPAGAPAAADRQASTGTGAGGEVGRPVPGPARGAGGTEEGSGRLYTVQVAAFLDSGSARAWADRLSAQDLPTWVSIAEVGGRTFHRVRVGAAPTVDSARRVGAVVRDRYEWPVWIAPLTAADRLPPDAIQRTRNLIESR